MPNNDHWVRQRDDGKWQDKKVGAARASGVFDSQSEAWDAARVGAKRDKAEAYLTNRHGQIRERNTYGHDPRRSKG